MEVVKFEYTAQYYHNGVWSMMIGAPITRNKESITRWINAQKKQARMNHTVPYFKATRIIRRQVLDWEPLNN